MKKLFATFMAITMMYILPLNAAENIFYRNGSGQWSVMGHGGNDKLNPACIMQTTWTDGSRLSVIQDLSDGELYINLEYMKWNIEGPYNTNHNMKIIFYSGRSSVALDGIFNLHSKNSIMIRGIKHESFVDIFADADKMSFVMPGTVPNVDIGLRGSSDAIQYTKQCMNASLKENLKTPKKGSNI